MNRDNYPWQHEVTCHPLGDSAVTVEFASRIDPLVHQKVRELVRFLEKCRFPGMIEYVPAYASVTVFYNPVEVRQMHAAADKSGKRSSFALVADWLMQAVGTLTQTEATLPRVVEIPVCYGGELGPDLAYVAQVNNLSEEEVIRLHTSARYTVYMIGFAPGFPYLGGMPERIATPRRPSPRLAIPAGSVGIGGGQTGIYPIETPGGWQLIGRTPLRLFRPEQHPPSLLLAGDLIRFCPITFEEYKAYEEEIR